MNDDAYLLDGNCGDDRCRSDRDEALRRLTALRHELHDISAAIGGDEYMDPPDGGSVTLAEQVRRMRRDLTVVRDSARESITTQAQTIVMLIADVREALAERNKYRDGVRACMETAQAATRYRLDAEKERDVLRAHLRNIVAAAGQVPEDIEGYLEALSAAVADAKDVLMEAAQ